MKEKNLSYWKEFWYKRSENGETVYTPNTRKFWATISWVLLCLWFIVLLVGVIIAVHRNEIKTVPWGFIGSMTGILIGNAQMAIGWYTLDKNNKRKYDNGLQPLKEAAGVLLNSRGEESIVMDGKIEETIKEI